MIRIVASNTRTGGIIMIGLFGRVLIYWQLGDNGSESRYLTRVDYKMPCDLEFIPNTTPQGSLMCTRDARRMRLLTIHLVDGEELELEFDTGCKIFIQSPDDESARAIDQTPTFVQDGVNLLRIEFQKFKIDWGTEYRFIIHDRYPLPGLRENPTVIMTLQITKDYDSRHEIESPHE